jgi:uncharacterized protein YegL
MLVVDTSYKMQGEPIAHLNRWLSEFENHVKSDVLLKRRMEVALISFGQGGVRLVEGFVSPRHFTAQTLTANGVAPIGPALRVALECIRTRKNELLEQSIPNYCRPLLIVITDAEPGDNDWEATAAEVRSEQERKALGCLPLVVSSNKNFKKLRQLSGIGAPLMLDQFDFHSVFTFIEIVD